MHQISRALIVLIALLGLLATPARAAEFLPGAKRILMLGDSITYGGGYVDRFELFLFTQYPERNFEVINCGLSSETVSGLSEEGHAGGKFPRPDLHERLTRVLETVKPDVVFACYGMNDGIYLPLAEDRFARFREGMQKLHQAVAARGAKIIHLTPAVFIPTHPEPRATSYDAVLTRYSEWLLEQRQTAGWQVIDLHGPMASALEAERARDPAFTFSKDRIHPNDAGHAVMADALLVGLGSERLPAFRRLLASDWLNGPEGRAYAALIRKRGRLLLDSYLTAAGHLRPGVGKGKPLPEANAEAAEMEAQIRATTVARF